MCRRLPPSPCVLRSCLFIFGLTSNLFFGSTGAAADFFPLLSRALACLDIYPNIDRIKHANCPVMIIHGCHDQEVNISHGKAMHDAVPRELQREPWWVPDRGHNDITEGRGKLAEYIQRLRLFLRDLEA